MRAAAVHDIPDDPDHRSVLAELALNDEDARVRRAAAERVAEVDDLVMIARGGRDEDVRRSVQDRLVSIANAPAEMDGDAARALDGLTEQKHFAAVAKTSPHDTVRTAALGQIHDARALGSVARHAADAQTALDAVGRLGEAAELIAVALKTDHKEAGITALEKAVDGDAAGAKDVLDNVANRAKNKSVAKRARALHQALLDAEAARRAALEQWQQRVAAVIARLEAVAAAPAQEAARREIADAEAEWRELAAGGPFELDPDTAARYGALVDAAQQAVEQHERAQAERRAEAERLEALRAKRLAICERLESAAAEAALDELDRARAEWEGLRADAEGDTDHAAILARFEEACRRAAQRYERRQEIERMNARLEELSREAEQITEGQETPEDAWRRITAEWASVSAQTEGADPAVVQRFTEAQTRVHAHEEERRAAAEKALRQHVQRVEQLIDRAQKRAAVEDLTLREADRLARDIRAALDAPPHLPERDQHALVERLKAAQAAVAPRLHELREMDEWKRFANAAVQEELIARTEALAAKYGFAKPDDIQPADLEKAAHELHEIQERWKQAAEAPRAQAQALWHRYRQAADPIQARVREFFAHRAEERKTNLERKQAIIERAEQLADSTDWIRTADELKKLQAEWLQIGPVPRQDTRTTWKRFREACDRFFTRRNEDLAQRKQTWAENLARKEALCVRAEALTTSTEWERAAAESRQLQAEWKTIGPVRRNKSEAIWQRFRQACDLFFDRYKRRDQIELEAKQADREGLVTELESLVPERSESSESSESSERTEAEGTEATEPTEERGRNGAGGEAPAEWRPLGGEQGPPPFKLDAPALLERVRALRSKWNQSTPVVRSGADPLSARFVNALERLLDARPDAFRGTELDVESNRQKMEKLCQRVESFVTENAATPVTSSQALASMLREALAANTIGGRAGEESKWKAMAEDVRQAQASWNRLGPVPGEAGRQLADRFHRACSRFFEAYRRRVPQQQGNARQRPVGAR